MTRSAPRSRASADPLVVEGEVLLERAQVGRDLGERDAQGWHARSVRERAT